MIPVLGLILMKDKLKAKEYAKIAIEGNYDVHSVSKVVNGLLGEIVTISKGRNVGTTSGLNGVVQEIRQKWKAVCRKAEGLNADGFDLFLIKHGLLNRDLTINTDLREIPESLMGA